MTTTRKAGERAPKKRATKKRAVSDRASSTHAREDRAPRKRAKVSSTPEGDLAQTTKRLRILGMEQVDDDVELVIGRGWGLRDAATNPCAHCPSKCCGFQIALTTVEVLRMAYTLRMSPASFVTVAPFTTGGAERFAHALTLDDGPSMLVLRRTDGWCTHLLRAGSETARCGVYELRPAVCRLFPFLFELDGKSHSVGHGNPICPVRWATTTRTEERLLSDALRWASDYEQDAEAASRWNDVDRPVRSEAALLDWLAVDEARAQGHDPRALERFPPRPQFAFLKAATRRVI